MIVLSLLVQDGVLKIADLGLASTFFLSVLYSTRENHTILLRRTWDSN
jgi:hypothetical protein